MDFDGINLRRKFLTGLDPESINVMIGKRYRIYFALLVKGTRQQQTMLCCTCAGSLHVQKLGVLTDLSANSGKLFPVGYQ